MNRFDTFAPLSDSELASVSGGDDGGGGGGDSGGGYGSMGSSSSDMGGSSFGSVDFGHDPYGSLGMPDMSGMSGTNYGPNPSLALQANIDSMGYGGASDLSHSFDPPAPIVYEPPPPPVFEPPPIVFEPAPLAMPDPAPIAEPAHAPDPVAEPAHAPDPIGVEASVHADPFAPEHTDPIAAPVALEATAHVDPASGDHTNETTPAMPHESDTVDATGHHEPANGDHVETQGAMTHGDHNDPYSGDPRTWSDDKRQDYIQDLHKVLNDEWRADGHSNIVLKPADERPEPLKPIYNGALERSIAAGYEHDMQVLQANNLARYNAEWEAKLHRDYETTVAKMARR